MIHKRKTNKQIGRHQLLSLLLYKDTKSLLVGGEKLQPEEDVCKPHAGQRTHLEYARERIPVLEKILKTQ